MALRRAASWPRASDCRGINLCSNERVPSRLLALHYCGLASPLVLDLASCKTLALTHAHACKLRSSARVLALIASVRVWKSASVAV